VAASFNDILSQEQTILFYDENIDFELCHCVNVEFIGLESLDYIVSSEIELSTVIDVLSIGTISDFDNGEYSLIEIEIVDFISDVSFGCVLNGPHIINYRETVRYEIFSNMVFEGISIGDEITRLGSRYISNSTFIILDTSGSVHKRLYDSVYDSILKDAVRALNPWLIQKFYVQTSNNDTYAIREGSGGIFIEFDSFNHKYILDSKYIDYIYSPQAVPVYSTEMYKYDPHVIYRDFSQIPEDVDHHDSGIEPMLVDGNLVLADGEDAKYDGGEQSSKYDIDSSIYHFVGFIRYIIDDVYSPPNRLFVGSEDLDDSIYSMSKGLYSESFNDFISGEIEIIRAIAPDGEYTIMSLKDYYSNPIEPSVAIYTDGNLSSIDDSIYSLAMYTGLSSLYPFVGESQKIIIPEYYISTLDGILSQEFNFVMNILDEIELSLDGFSQRAIDVYIGESNIELARNGLYKDFIMDDFGLVTTYITAWYKPGSTIAKLSNTVFYGIGFDIDMSDLKLISDSRLVFIYADWDGAPVENTIKYIPDIKSENYYIVKNDEGDFVVISLSSFGGSIVHMHKTDEKDRYSDYAFLRPSEEAIILASENYRILADGYYAEHAARVVSSNQYMRHAKILKETIDGISWPDYMVEYAVEFMSNLQNEAEFFISNRYNPYQIFELIYNKNEHVIGSDFFDFNSVHEFNGVYFVYDDYPKEKSDWSDYIEYVFNSYFSNINESRYYINTTDSAKLISGSIFVKIIDGCSDGTPCSYALVSDNYVSAIVETPESIVFIPSEPDYSRKLVHYEFDTGIVDVPGAVYLCCEIARLSNISGITSTLQSFRMSIGVEYDPVYYSGELIVGLTSIGGIISEENNIVVSTPSYVTSDVISDFYIKLHFDLKTDFLSDVYSCEGNFSIDKNREDLDCVKDNHESIWLKMFFPADSGRSYIEKTIMDMIVQDAEFSKGFTIPYRYVDEYIESSDIQAKAGDDDIKETKYKDIEDLGGEDVTTPTDIVCGDERRMTYLQYLGFNHIVNYNDSNIIFGNYSTGFKEIIHSPYIKILERKVTLPGTTLSDSEALSRSISEAILARIDNLDQVYDWKVEEFSLEKEDLMAYSYDAMEYESIDSSFRSSLKFVLTTMGEDALAIEQEEAKVNMFPSFPDRPAPNDFLQTHKVQQFIKISRWNDV